MLEEEFTVPDEIVASLEGMLAGLRKRTDELFSESLAKLNELQATLDHVSQL
jgi:hypothetical protein